MELLREILLGCWGVTVEMAPYLLLGFAIAGALSVLVSPESVERHLGGRGIWPVMKAALFGVPLPLCSCGVIPVAASLRKHGASKGATISFLLSTPQTGVDSILVTYSLLGPVMALFRPIAAFLSGLIGGIATDKLDGAHSPPPPAADEDGDDDCCSATAKRGRWVRALRHGFVVLPRDIAMPMIAGIIVAGIVGALVPEDFFAGYLGRGIVPMLVMMAVGIPVYVCATASVPIAAAMILKGLSPGAALVFLIAGPATNAATLTTLWKMLGRRSVFIYLGTVAVTSLACGILLDLILGGASPLAAAHAQHVHEHAATGATPFELACTVTLLVVLAAAWLTGFFKRDAKKEPCKCAVNVER